MKYQDREIDINPWSGTVTEVRTPAGYVFIKVLGFDGIEREFKSEFLKLL